MNTRILAAIFLSAFFALALAPLPAKAGEANTVCGNSFLSVLELAVPWIIADIPVTPFPPSPGDQEENRSVVLGMAVSMGNLDLGIIGENEFLAGYVLSTNRPIHWESNFPWELTVVSKDPDLGTSDDGSFQKPLDDFAWKLSSGGDNTWVPLKQTPTELSFSEDEGQGVIYIDVKVLIDWLEDRPGNYGTDLLFTISPL